MPGYEKNDDVRPYWAKDSSPELIQEQDGYRLYTDDHLNIPEYRKDARKTSSTSIFVYHDMIIYRDMALVQGKTAKGKEWSRWETRKNIILSMRRKDKHGVPMLRVYANSIVNRRKYFRDASTNPELVAGGRVGEFVFNQTIEMMSRVTGETVEGEYDDSDAFAYAKLCYPLLGEFLRTKPIGNPQIEVETTLFCRLGPGLMRGNVREFVAETFGKRYLRKDFIKLIVSPEVSTRQIRLIATIAKKIDVNLAVRFLRQDAPWLDGKYPEPFRGIKQLFAVMSEREQSRLLMSLGKDTRGEFMDCGRTSLAIQEAGQLDRTDLDFSDWNSLHDTLSNKLRKIERPNHVIKQTKLSRRLSGNSFDLDGDTFTIVSPEDTYSLIDWGNNMGNCIGGYGQDALVGSSLLFAMFDQERKMVANIELSPSGEIRQLFGKFNQKLKEPLDKASRALIDDVVKKFKEETLAEKNEGQQLSRAA